MKILVVGSSGWTGNKIVHELLNRNVIVDTSSHGNIPETLDQYDFVINCAGVTGVPNVDACESIKKQTIEGNAIFPVLLYEKCKHANVRFAHFSSGCIYTGVIEDDYADPNFFGSIYSVSKGVSDSYLNDKALVFRIRMPFTNKNEQKNYLTKIRYYATHGKLHDSGQNSLTDLDEAVKVACDLVLENAPNGAYNLVNSGTVNMRELAALMNLDAEWLTGDDIRKSTVADRSTCVIPAYEKMSPLIDALKRALV